VPLLQEEIGRAQEIVEHVLLAVEHALAVPVFAVFAASAQMGHRVEAPLLEELDHAAAEGGRVAHVEAAVPGEERGPSAVGGTIARVDEEHGNEGAVARGVVHEAHPEAIGVDLARRARP
jgi:hypothetical protein